MIKYLNVTIRQFSHEDDVTELTVLLNKSYQSLADLGFKFLASHQDASVTLDRISKGKCFIALDDDRIIGTISYYPPEATKGSLWYDHINVASFGQFAVDPGFQRMGLGHKLLSLVEQYAFETGAEHLALDTAEDADHLIKYYQNRGYKFVEYVQWTLVTYRSVIMNKNIRVVYEAY